MLKPTQKPTNKEVSIRVVEGSVPHGGVAAVDVDGSTMSRLGISCSCHGVQPLEYSITFTFMNTKNSLLCIQVIYNYTEDIFYIAANSIYGDNLYCAFIIMPAWSDFKYISQPLFSVH